MSEQEADTTHSEHHAICPLCVRIVSKEDRYELRNVISNHNDTRHDGERVAQFVESWELQDWLDRIKEKYGADVHDEIGSHIVQKDPWGVIDD